MRYWLCQEIINCNPDIIWLKAHNLNKHQHFFFLDERVRNQVAPKKEGMAPIDQKIVKHTFHVLSISRKENQMHEDVWNGNFGGAK